MSTEAPSKPSFQVDITVADPHWEDDDIGFNPVDMAEIAVRETLFCVQFTSDHAAELSVLLAHNDLIQTLNREYRGKDSPTNVLSFPSEEHHEQATLGDIILARETLIREADEQLKPLREHFIHLIVHGTLHLLGYDHIEEEEANDMESMEIWILQRLGIKNPYLAMDMM